MSKKIEDIGYCEKKKTARRPWRAANVAVFTSPNRSVYASPPVGGSASTMARSIASLIPTPLLRHSLSALEMLRISLFGPPKRRQQPKRYAPFAPKLVEYYVKRLRR
jgi:hypothetical protein